MDYDCVQEIRLEKGYEILCGHFANEAIGSKKIVEDILLEVNKVFRHNKQISLYEFNDICGYYNDENDHMYGWDSLEGTRVEEITKDIWIIIMPEFKKLRKTMTID